MPRRSVSALLGCALILIPARGAAAQGPAYTVSFPASSDTTGAQALASLPDRNKAVIQRLACGSEVELLNDLQSKSVGEDPLAIVLAKMAWAVGLQKGVFSPQVAEDCTASRTFDRGFLSGIHLLSGHTLWEVIGTDRFEAQAEINRMIGDAAYRKGGPNLCTYAVTSISANPQDPFTFNFAFKVSPLCMRQEINTTLAGLERQGQLGSSGLPCWSLPISDFKTKTEGEWDVSVRALTRVLYFSDQHSMPGNGGALLDEDVRNHVRDDLLNVSGPMRYEESYSWMQCGNEENDTGSPQDLADDRGFLHDVGQSLGDFWDWFKHHWSLLLLAVPGLAELELFAGEFYLAAGPAVVAAVAVVGAAAAAELRIPETENHLLQIESSRYLKNQLIIRELGDYPGVEDFRDDQEDIKEWLLEHLQTYIKDDFSEYNARPYQRYSVNSILNLADFAEDTDVKTGARLVLEYLTAKVAVGSLQARRFVPFRRLVEAMYSDANRPNPAKTPGDRRHLFDMDAGADHQIARMLLLTGITGQLSDPPSVSDSAPAEMIYQATSGYLPDPALLDLAFNGTLGSYDQWIRHASYEVFSRGTGFLVSGGGLTSGPANRALLAGVPVPGTGNTNDEGVAVPITLMTTRDRAGQNLQDLIRIEGPKATKSVDANGWGTVDSWTFDDNLCVWHGFACGLNLAIPDAFQNCIVPRTADPGGGWTFIDSNACDAFREGPRFLITAYSHTCPSSDDGCEVNFGFFHVTSSNLGLLSTADLIQKVIDSNPAGTMGDRPKSPMSGRYYDPFGGTTIVYDSVAHQHDSSRWGIESVNGAATVKLDDRQRAEGELWTPGGRPPLTAARDEGIVHAYNNRLGIELILDFSDVKHPSYPGHP